MIKFLYIFILFILSFSIAYGNYKITTKDRLIINKISSKMKKLIDIKDLNSKKTIESKINNIQQKHKDNIKIFTIIEEVKKIININEIPENIYTNTNNKYKIDYEKIKLQWLNWHNKERIELWRPVYSYDEKLNNTALEWSDIQKERWWSSHKRDTNDSYYNYQKIVKWFKNRWVSCEKSWRITITESIWYNSYYCNDNDCNDELIKSLKSVFNRYMKEKWKSNNPHYKSIVHKNLTKIGAWISIKENKNHYNYYITTHYCTKLKQ